MNKVIVILGPTGVGKTKMSIELAKILSGEIINADSTQVYKDMNIGTAKITEEEKENIPHHLFDIKEITEDYSVCDYQKDCRIKIEDILSRGKTPILVGGTGLYIKAALYDYKFDSVEMHDYSNLSDTVLYERLLHVDPKTTIHINNRKRVERALSYYDTNHIPFSEKEKTEKLLYPTIFIGLTTNRENLYERINSRVDKMIEMGLIEEAKTLYDRNIVTKALMTPICYKELFESFNSIITQDEAILLIKQRSRNYAKRQYTWFNHQMDVDWFDVDFNNFTNTINSVLEHIKKEY